MTRRAIKKALRRAEEAIREERFVDAERIYRGLFDAFNNARPSLLDHAACIYGLISTLALMQRTDDAINLSEAAVDILGARSDMQVAA